MGLPLPVRDFSTHPTIDVAFTIITGVITVGVLTFSIRLGVHRRTWVPVLLFVGGFVGALVEPIACTLGLVQYPTFHNQIVALEAFNHPIPLFVVLSYGIELGIGALALWMLLEGGGGGRAVLQVWVAIILIDTMLESPAIWLHVFRYYGHQPFDFWGFPLWWAPIDAAIGLAPALAAYLAPPASHRPRNAAYLLLLFPISGAVVYAGAGWPVFVLMNTELPAVVTWLGGIVSTFTIVTYVFALSKTAFRASYLREIFVTGSP